MLSAEFPGLAQMFPTYNGIFRPPLKSWLIQDKLYLQAFFKYIFPKNFHVLLHSLNTQINILVININI